MHSLEPTARPKKLAVSQKEKIVFQPLLFRSKLVSFREATIKGWKQVMGGMGSI